MTDESSLSLRVAGKLPRRIWIAGALSVGSGVLVAAGESAELVWLAVWFGLLALVSVRRVRPEINLQLDDGAVTLVESGQRISLEDIEAIITRPRSASVGVWAQDREAALVCRDREIALRKFTPGRQEWLKALHHRMQGLDPLRGLPGELRSFWQEEAAACGPQFLFTARALRRMPAFHVSGGIITDSLISAVLTGLLLSIFQPFIPLLKPMEHAVAVSLIGVGAFCLVMVFLIKLSRRSTLKRLGAGGIVVSPGGLALNYGQLKGVLRWEELSSIQLTHSGGSQILRLRVPGSSILLTEVFDKPLLEIHGAILRYAHPC